jgi:hypothetical protein
VAEARRIARAAEAPVALRTPETDSKHAPTSTSTAASPSAAATASAASAAAPEAASKAAAEAEADKGSAYTPESRLQQLREWEQSERDRLAKEESEAQRLKLERDPWGGALDKLNQFVVWEEDKNGGKLPPQRNPSKLVLASSLPPFPPLLGLCLSVSLCSLCCGTCAQTCTEQEFVMRCEPLHSPTLILVDIAVPKYLDTSLLRVEVHPNWFQVLAKDKLLLLHTPHEVSTGGLQVVRVPHNGYLRLVMPVVVVEKGSTASKKGMGAGAEVTIDTVDVTNIKAKKASAAKPASSDEKKGVAPVSTANFRAIVKKQNEGF